MTVIVLILIALCLVFAGVVYWVQGHPSLYIAGTEAKITEIPSCGSEYCSASYAAVGTDGQKYSITSNIEKGGPPTKCIEFEEMNIGDEVKFNLYLEPTPANALTTVRTYNTCYPAGQNKGYFIKAL